MAQSSKRQGLRLKLGGAPNEPHVVGGLGYFRPDLPTPVGGEGDALTVEEAREAAKKHSDVLELVEISAGEVSEAERVAETDLAAGRNAVVEARRDGRADDDVSRTKDEQAAVTKKGDE